ncbi:hypothetical protein AB6Q13_13295 [Ralstonia solanacearum]|uniref:hypothetical protein n=1 Tax=Ralstonia solanacearum TaxID=305 RepID=UPI0023063A6C|nr:hypothetical protein [Ralstonia solanacearum]MDB0567904.1 hypothetical protein [Ralstonia solanacearum]MDB0577768.1 hypothetical protein [Ralstonia solanacearum]
MTSTPRTYQISPEQKGRIIGALLLLPAFLHAVFTQCQIRNTWPVMQGLFVAGFLIAAMLLARAIVKRPRGLPPLPAWNTVLALVMLPSLAGALAAVDGIAFTRAAVFFTAEKHTRTVATVEESGSMRGCSAHIEFFDPTIEASVTACASDYGFAARAGDRIIVEKLTGPIGMRLLAVGPLRSEGSSQ